MNAVRAKRLLNGEEVEVTCPVETGLGLGTDLHPQGLIIVWVPPGGTLRQADLVKGDMITAINFGQPETSCAGPPCL